MEFVPISIAAMRRSGAGMTALSMRHQCRGEVGGGQTILSVRADANRTDKIVCPPHDNGRLKPAATPTPSAVSSRRWFRFPLRSRLRCCRDAAEGRCEVGGGQTILSVRADANRTDKIVCPPHDNDRLKPVATPTP